MPERDKLVAVLGEWVAKAENDLKNATQVLKLGEDPPTDTVCFHAQQCVEKYLKALLVAELIDFPKTHNLKTIIELLPDHLRPEISVAEQRQLTDYATGARYPGWPAIPLKEARHAVAVARRVRKEARKHLPRAALRRRK